MTNTLHESVNCAPRRARLTLVCRACGASWLNQSGGRPAKLCASCKAEYRYCYRCDLAKPRNEFHQISGNQGRACKKCMTKLRSVTCRGCGVDWELDRSGAPPKLCPDCESSLKYCNKCGEVKPHSEFNRASGTRTGLNDCCRGCAQEWFVTRGSKLRRANDLMTKYGVTLDEWDAMWSAQGGKCACCQTQLTSKPALDHCHQTGAVRGILCNNCNTGLGKLGDTVDGLVRAEAYLWSRRNVLAEIAAGLHDLSERHVA